MLQEQTVKASTLELLKRLMADSALQDFILWEALRSPCRLDIG